MQKEINFEEFVNHPDWDMRVTAAKHGFGLDTLVNDENERVRMEVAKQGFGLDKLVNDNHYIVREAVAEQGYGLDKLVNDKNEEVSKIASEKKNNLNKKSMKINKHIGTFELFHLTKNNFVLKFKDEFVLASFNEEKKAIVNETSFPFPANGIIINDEAQLAEIRKCLEIDQSEEDILRLLDELDLDLPFDEPNDEFIAKWESRIYIFLFLCRKNIYTNYYARRKKASYFMLQSKIVSILRDYELETGKDFKNFDSKLFEEFTKSLLYVYSN